MKPFQALLGSALLLAWFPAMSPAVELPTCVIDFDTGSACPDTTSVCGATFNGGLGCSDLNFPGCRTTGDRYYRINTGNLTISLSGDLTSLAVLFAGVGTGTGQMKFFDANDNQVSGTVNGQHVSMLVTNGNCKGGVTPPTQTIALDAPVRTVTVSNVTGELSIDTFHINPLGTVPTVPRPWGLMKVLYR